MARIYFYFANIRMMHLEELRGLIELYSYFVLFPLVALEGPFVTIVAGFLANVGVLNFFIAYTVVVLGDVAGDCVWYSFGRFSGGFIDRILKLFGVSQNMVTMLEKHYGKNSMRTIIVGKFIYGVEISFLIAAGLAKVPFRKFVLYTFIPTVPKSLFFLLIGFYFGGAFTLINKYLNNAAIIIPVFIIAAIILLFLYRLLVKRLTKNIWT